VAAKPTPAERLARIACDEDGGVPKTGPPLFAISRYLNGYLAPTEAPASGQEGRRGRRQAWDMALDLTWYRRGKEIEPARALL